MKVTAAVARKTGEPLVVEQLELDALRPNEVRVRLVGCGICHTDAVVRDGIYPTPLPAVLGHEGSGVVEEIGSEVTTTQPGDHVVLCAAYCGKCSRCKMGQMAYCENVFAEDFGGRRRDGTTSLSSGKEVISSHFFGQSSFATYANVVENSVVVVDKSVPLEILGPLGCGLNTGAGAVLNELNAKEGTTLAVFGTGAVGSGAIMAGGIAGCTTVIAVDLHDSRLKLAKELGATHTINTKNENLGERIKEITGGKGVDAIIDTTAVPALLRQGADALALRGTLILVGAAKSGTEVKFEVGDSLIKGWTFKTVVQGSSVPQVFIPRLIELYKQGRFPFDKLLGRYKLDDINKGFDDSADGSVVKPLLVY